MNCIIVDDDNASIKVIEQLAASVKDLDVAETFNSAIDAAEYIRSNEVDVIFLDMEMPEMSGLDFLGSLSEPPQVIINSAKSEYAIDAYNYEVCDYLLKPASLERFKQAVQKTREAIRQQQIVEDTVKMGSVDNIFIKEDNVMRRIDLADINWVEALGDYVNIHLDKSKKTVLTTMKNIQTKLPEDRFSRVHRSYIVNIKKIDVFDSSFVVVKEKLIPIGNSYKKKLSDKLNLL